MNFNVKYLGFLVLIILCLGVYLVLGFTHHVSTVSPASNTNISGTVTLSATVDSNNVTNVTWYWTNTSGNVVLVSVVHNTSPEQTTFTNSTFSTSLLIDNLYNISVVAYNISGDNNSVANVTTNVIVDDTYPMLSDVFGIPSGGPNVSGNVIFNISVYDPYVGVYNANRTGIKAVAYQFISNSTTNATINRTAENASGNWSLVLDTTTISNGRYYVYLVFNDTADNLNNTENITIFVDNTPPTVTINTLSGLYQKSTDGLLNLNATVTDSTLDPVGGVGIGTVLFRISNGSVPFNLTGVLEGGYWNVSLNLTRLTEANHTISVFANDTENNYNVTAQISLVIDDTPPKMILGSPHNNTLWSNSNGAFIFNYTDVGSPLGNCSLMVEPGLFYGTNSSVRRANTTIQANATLSEALHNWTINCTDLAGNQNTSSWFYVDVIDVRNLTSLNNNWTNNRSVNSTPFIFDFRLNSLVNAMACQLYITNNSGIYVAQGANSTVVNSTSTTIRNNVSLHNGSMNWTINCTNGSNMISTGVNILNVDNTSPVMSVPTVSGITSSTAVLTIANVNDANFDTCTYSGDKSGAFSVDGSILKATLSSLSAATTYSITASCTDRAGNSVSATPVSITTSAESSTGSGAGGSGGGAVSKVVGQFEQTTWNSINEGETATMPIENGVIGVTEVSFKVGETTNGAWLKVEKISSLPSEVVAPAGKTYSNIKISSNNIEKALDGTATIKFKVTNDWLSENSLEQRDIVLLRHTDNGWIELPTVLGQSDDTYVHYTATTPGFSYFVIGVKSTVAAVEAVGGEATEVVTAGEEAIAAEEAAKAAKEPINKLWFWLIPALVVIVVAAYLIWQKRK